LYISNVKVSLIGPYPPPYGGISVHIQRLKEQLETHHLRCIVYDNTQVAKKEANVIMVRNMLKWSLDQLLSRDEDIIHYHGYSAILINILSLLAITKRKKGLVTLHSFRYDPKNMNLPDRFAFWIARIAQSCFLVVSPEIKDKIIFLGIKPENIEVIPSFIPPTISEEDIAEIPQEVWSFIDGHRPILLANAFKISFYNNQDLYGLDMCIDLCANLKQSYPKIGFVFCLPDIGDYDYFKKMKQRIADKQIEENFLFQTKPCQMYPIIMKSDLFVRPTNTDGDAVSIREALHFKVPAVASDVCPRPEGTILFKCRDIDDLTSKVKEVLDNYDEHKKRLETITLENNAEKIINIYHKIAGDAK